MPQVSFESYNSLLFHGGDTGSIPVRDAKQLASKLGKIASRKSGKTASWTAPRTHTHVHDWM